MSTFDLENPAPKPGDSLRDEAANLLSARFGRPVREKRVQGKKVDLYFAKEEFGRTTHIFVEAKDYASPLRRDDVSKIWADFSGIVKQHLPGFLLLITRSGLTSDAEVYINEEQTDIRHQTIWQLENETLGLTDYVRSLADLFDEQGLSSYYVESRAKQALYESEGTKRFLSDESVRIFDVLQDWVRSSETKPIAILGGYGAGKSSLARRMVSAQAKAALTDPLARRPVLIRLGDLSRYSSIEGLLGGMFTHDFPVDRFNVRHFLMLNQKGRLLIVLDGFDEMKHAMSWADFRHQITDLNRLTGGAAKVILLGRPSAFTSTEEHFHVLRGMKKWEGGFRKLPDWPEFIEYDLDEFTREERSQFVAGYLQHRARQGPFGDVGRGSWIRGRVQEVDKLADAEPEIFGKPVHAKILVDMASDPNVDLSRFADGITRWGLYEVFFSSLAERESEKEARRPISEAGRLSFIQEVAFWLWTRRSGSISFPAADLPDQLITGLPLGDAADVEAAKREYLTGSFLEKKSGDIYYFGHRSFAEYLVANRMISKIPSPGEQSVYSSLVRDGVLVFLREAPDRSKFHSWLENLSTAQGEIHVQYLMFLAEMLGGRDQLHDALPATSIWRPILQVFDEDMGMSGHVPARIREAMRTENNNLFFLLLSLLQYQAPIQRGKRDEYAAMVAAALLDRLFIRATLDEAARKAIVENDGNDARALAQMVIPALEYGIGERQLLFKGARLLKEKAESLRAVGVDLVLHPPATLVTFTNETRLPWSTVLAFMSREGATKAMSYFQRSETLRDVFTRSAAPPSRSISRSRRAHK